MAMQNPYGSCKAFKLAEAYNARRFVGNNRTSLKRETTLIGNSNESSVTIEGINTSALIDTGSCVSTVTKEFYEKHLNHIELQPVQGLLKIECADGNELPYSGYIESTLCVDGIPREHEQSCIFLIVPESGYSSRVPVLLGTNVLATMMTNCKEQFGPKYLQNARLSTPWYLAFRCMTLREKTLIKNHNRLALIKSLEKDTVILKPNSQVTIRAGTCHRIEYGQTAAIVEATREGSMPADLDITPTVITYSATGKDIFNVQISNITTRRVAISPNSIIGELNPVVVQQMQTQPDTQGEPDVSEQITIDTENLTDDQTARTKDLLLQYQDIFSKGDTDIGHYRGVKHKIQLKDETPFKQRYRRIPPSMIDEVRSHLEQLHSAGVIRKSHSPFASNVVLVRKKDNSMRMCVDYRTLNKKTIKDSYALPRIEEILDTLSGSKYFSVLDMKSGYHQVEIEEQHKERTAFTVGPLGLWEFNRLAFGLTNSPSTYQRLMEECLGDLNMKICVIYLDDLIIFADSFDEHMKRLQIVLDRLRECNLKLSAKKCQLLQQKVKYVGFIVSEQGIETDPEKVTKVKNWPIPSNPDEVRQFVGFAGYYRRFIQNFSDVTRPLREVMPPPDQRKKRCSKEIAGWKWGTEQEDAFNHLKELLTSAPILAYARYDQPFELHIDASTSGLGAVLYQQQNGKQRVISYGSRTLNRSEQNYPAMKLEFLALKWAVTEKFSDYLYGNKFSVMTDNNPLTYALTTAKLDATGQRWIAALSAYEFDITYKPGRLNTDADAMSRYPLQKDRQPIQETIVTNTIQAICNRTHHPLVETIGMSALDILEATECPGQPMAQTEMREIRKGQREDPVIGYWCNTVRDRKRPHRDKFVNNKANMLFFRAYDSLKIMRGLLYRVVHVKEEEVHQLVLPSVYIEQVLAGLHNEMGHPGREKTLSLIRDRFVWQGMSADTESWIKNCGRCMRRKAPTNSKAPLVNITSTYPLERVCMDYLTLEPSKGGIANVLVITDHYTRYAMAIPTRNQTAKTTADAFFNNFVVHYGFPATLHTDQGANFEIEVISELCQLAGIKKSRTTIYHPMSNGMTERFNRTLISMLGTLEPEEKGDWKKHISALVHAYNCMRHDSTGFSPFELMFGRAPRLPIDLVFGTMKDGNEPCPKSDYVKELKSRLEKSYELAGKTAEESRQKQKQQFDKTAKASNLKEGDKVLVKILAFKGKHKLADKFEEEVYTVERQPNEEIPVFVVKDPNGKLKTLHRNHLLPVNTKFEKRPTPAPRRTNVVNKDKEEEVHHPRTRESVEQTLVRTREEHDKETEESEEEDIDIAYSPTTTDEDECVSEEEEDEEEEEATEDVVRQEDTVRALVPEQQQQLRRSTRERRKPKWYGMYHVGQSQAYYRPEREKKENTCSRTTETLKKILRTGILHAASPDLVEKMVEAVLEDI